MCGGVLILHIPLLAGTPHSGSARAKRGKLHFCFRIFIIRPPTFLWLHIFIGQIYGSWPMSLTALLVKAKYVISALSDFSAQNMGHKPTQNMQQIALGGFIQ